MTVVAELPAVSADLLCEAMRRAASSVAIVTTEGHAGRAGVTVSSFTSLSLEPPSVLVCVHGESRALPAILANGVFAVSLLGEDQSRVARAFAGQVPELREDRFGAAEWQMIHTGAPVAAGAVAGFDCRLSQQIEFGTHRILIGEVLGAVLQPRRPLVYLDKNFHRAVPLVNEGELE